MGGLKEITTDFPLKIEFTCFSMGLTRNFHGKKRGGGWNFFAVWRGPGKNFAINIFHQASLTCVCERSLNMGLISNVCFSFTNSHKTVPTALSSVNKLAFCKKKSLMAHNWQKWKRVFLTCPCHKIYSDKAVGLKSCKHIWKNHNICENVKFGAISWKFDIVSITA